MTQKTITLDTLRHAGKLATGDTIIAIHKIGSKDEKRGKGTLTAKGEIWCDVDKKAYSASAFASKVAGTTVSGYGYLYTEKFVKINDLRKELSNTPHDASDRQRSITSFLSTRETKTKQPAPTPPPVTNPSLVSAQSDPLAPPAENGDKETFSSSSEMTLSGSEDDQAMSPRSNVSEPPANPSCGAQEHDSNDPAILELRATMRDAEEAINELCAAPMDTDEAPTKTEAMDVGPDALDAPSKARSSGTFKIYNVEPSTTKTINIFDDTGAVTSFVEEWQNLRRELYPRSAGVPVDVASPENIALVDRLRRLLLDTRYHFNEKARRELTRPINTEEDVTHALRWCSVTIDLLLDRASEVLGGLEAEPGAQPTPWRRAITPATTAPGRINSSVKACVRNIELGLLQFRMLPGRLQRKGGLRQVQRTLRSWRKSDAPPPPAPLPETSEPPSYASLVPFYHYLQSLASVIKPTEEKPSYRLRVLTKADEEDDDEDARVIYMNPQKMDELHVFRGDVVIVGNCKHNLELLAVPSDTCEVDDVCIAASMQERLKIKEGAFVTLAACGPNATDLFDDIPTELMELAEDLETSSDIWSLVLQGYSTEQIAAILKTQVHVVDADIEGIFEKLGRLHDTMDRASVEEAIQDTRYEPTLEELEQIDAGDLYWSQWGKGPIEWALRKLEHTHPDLWKRLVHYQLAVAAQCCFDDRHESTLPSHKHPNRAFAEGKKSFVAFLRGVFEILGLAHFKPILQEAGITEEHASRDRIPDWLSEALDVAADTELSDVLMCLHALLLEKRTYLQHPETMAFPDIAECLYGLIKNLRSVLGCQNIFESDYDGSETKWHGPLSKYIDTYDRKFVSFLKNDLAGAVADAKARGNKVVFACCAGGQKYAEVTLDPEKSCDYEGAKLRKGWSAYAESPNPLHVGPQRRGARTPQPAFPLKYSTDKGCFPDEALDFPKPNKLEYFVIAHGGTAHHLEQLRNWTTVYDEQGNFSHLFAPSTWHDGRFKKIKKPAEVVERLGLTYRPLSLGGLDFRSSPDFMPPDWESFRTNGFASACFEIVSLLNHGDRRAALHMQYAKDVFRKIAIPTRTAIANFEAGEKGQNLFRACASAFYEIPPGADLRSPKRVFLAGRPDFDWTLRFAVAHCDLEPSGGYLRWTKQPHLKTYETFFLRKMAKMVLLGGEDPAAYKAKVHAELAARMARARMARGTKRAHELCIKDARSEVPRGTRVRLADPRFRGKLGTVVDHKHAWYRVQLDAGGIQSVRLMFLQREDEPVSKKQCHRA